jgi:uncharacterized protein (DUF2236 family)
MRAIRTPKLRGPGATYTGPAAPGATSASLCPYPRDGVYGCPVTPLLRPPLVPVQAERELLIRVHRERAVWLGYGAALLLHAADPHIAQAVADHSVFLRDPGLRLERLYSTGDTMFFLIFGTPYEVRQAAHRINCLHDRINGTLREDYPAFPVGTPYSAHDPVLMTWVHVALHATLLAVYEDLVSPLAEAERDRYCREAAAIEPLLGIPAGTLPRDWSTLRAQFAARLPLLAVGAPGRRIAPGILNPPLPWWARPVVVLARLWTVGLLPPTVRAAYGLPWGRGHEATFLLSRRLLRGLLPRLPEWVRRIPPELMARTG